MSSAFHASKAALAHMQAKKWGRIIDIASIHALIASPFKSAYIAAKHGLVGLTKTIALENAGHGITCNAICPAYVKTPLLEKQLDDQAKIHGISREKVIADIMLAPQPVKHLVEIKEVVGLAMFLCSDGARTITGTALPLDGGWTAL